MIAANDIFKFKINDHVLHVSEDEIEFIIVNRRVIQTPKDGGKCHIEYDCAFTSSGLRGKQLTFFEHEIKLHPYVASDEQDRYNLT